MTTPTVAHDLGTVYQYVPRPRPPVDLPDDWEGDVVPLFPGRTPKERGALAGVVFAGMLDLTDAEMDCVAIAIHPWIKLNTGSAQ